MTSVRNVAVGKPLATGGVLIGDLGAEAPEDARTALDSAFVAAGYVGEDGLTETTDRSTEKVKAWGGDIVRVLQTDFSVTYSFTFIETHNSTVLETVYGDANVTTAPATGSAGTLRTVKINADTLPHKSFVFDMRDGDSRIRIYVPDGQVTEVGEVTYSDGELIGYQVTVEAFRDSELNANALKFLDDGVTSSGE
jgi:hypothetical protein